MTWTETTLADLITLQRGYDLPSKNRVPGPVPVLSAGEKISYHNEAKVAGPGFVIGRSTNLGIPRWSDEDFWPLNTTLFAKDFKGNNPRWLFYLFQILDLSGFDSGTAQGSLNRNYIGSFRVSAPDRNEQDRIVDVIGSLDDKIAANNEVRRLSDEMIQSLWRKLINEDSSFVEFGDVIQLNPRTTAPKGSRLTTIEMKNLPEKGFTVETWADREAKGGSRYLNGDTLLARITPCFENGKCGYVDFLEPGEVGAGSTEFIVLRPQAGIPPAAPYAIARSSEFRTFAAQTMTGTSGRQRVQARDLETYEIAWPNEDLLSGFNSKTSPSAPHERKDHGEGSGAGSHHCWRGHCE